MITLTAKINILSGENDNLSILSHNFAPNNISSDIEDVLGKKTDGGTPFILNSTLFNENAALSSNVDYFIGNTLSDENGNFKTPYTISLNIVGLNNLSIAFDIKNNRYPKKIDLYSSIKTTEEFDKADSRSATVSSLSNNSAWLTYFYDQVPDYVNSSEDIKVVFNSTISDFTYEVTDNGSRYDIEIKRTSGGSFSNVSITVNFIKNRTTALEIIKTYNITTPIFIITEFGDSDTINIAIDNWNEPNSPLVVTGIYTSTSIEIGRNNLISIECSIFDRSNLKLPSFGIISNTGNLKFNDTDGLILKYAEQLMLEKGLPCELYLNNTLSSNGSTLIGLFETDEWDYENDNKVVSVSLKDDLEEWQEINISAIEYDPRKSIEENTKPFKWLYDYLWGLTKINYTMLSFDELDEETKYVLENTYIQYPLLEADTLWTAWGKLCEVCQLHIYKNNDGVVVCRYNGGN